MKRLLLLAALVAALLLATCAVASPPRHRFTSDEIRWYLQGIVSGASPHGWEAIDGRCVTGSQAFVCLIVAKNSASGAKACYRAAVSFTGRFLLPLKNSPCPASVINGTGTGPKS